MTNLSPHLESMTVLDDLNFASGVWKHAGEAENDGQRTRRKDGSWENTERTLAPCGSKTGSHCCPLAELSPNESHFERGKESKSGTEQTKAGALEDSSAAKNTNHALQPTTSTKACYGRNKTLTTKPLGEDNSNPAENNLNNSPCPAMDGCLENGIARLGTHNAEQPGKAVSDALADGPQPRQLLEDAA